MQAKLQNMSPEALRFSERVLYEDNHLLIVNKLPSEIVQGDKTGDVPLVEEAKAYVGQKHNKPGNVFLGVVHRIDRPVSGAVVFARTSKALARMNALLRDKGVHKSYLAVVKEKPPKPGGRLEHFLKKNEKQNKSYVVDEGTPGAKKAALTYTLAGASDRYHLLEVELLTGRHHQIRVQLAAVGCPIKGDVKYGYDRPNRDGSIHLHARFIGFEHPVRREMLSVVAPFPPGDALWKHFQNTINL